MSSDLWFLNIAGGAALLLWGTRMVRTGVLRAYGAELRRWLGRATRSRMRAFTMGLGVASVVQSSTATALLAVSFAGKGLLGTSAGLAAMLGADLGSTLVVQVLALDLSWLAPLLLLAGVVAFMAGPGQRWRHVGRVAIGLGLMLLALFLVVSASAPLRESVLLQDLLAAMASAPVFALLTGALIAWLAHSSVATVLLVMSLATIGAVPLELGLALVLGANVGSGVIPLALCWRSGSASRRIPLGNLGFRFAGALLVLPLIGLAHPYLDLLGPAPGRQIANAHTLFNLGLAVVFLPLVTIAARLLDRFLPDAVAGADPTTPRYLDAAALDTPAAALACATREALRMADTVEVMLGRTSDVFRDNDSELLETLSAFDDEVDTLHEEIKLYLTRLSRHELSEADSRRCMELIGLVMNLEHVGDIVDKGLLDLARRKIKHQLSFSPEGWCELTTLHDRAMDQLKLAINVFVSGDVETARQLVAEKESFGVLERQGAARHLERLRCGQIESVETSALHLDMQRDLKRITSHLTAVAYPILHASGQLRRSRLRKPTKAHTTNSPSDRSKRQASASNATPRSA